MYCVCVLSVCLVCVFVLRSTAFAGGQKNVITQSVLVRLGCPLEARQLLRRVSQSHYQVGANFNIFKFFFRVFHLYFFLVFSGV